MRTDQNFLLYFGMYPAWNESGDAGFLDARSLTVLFKETTQEGITENCLQTYKHWNDL